MIPSAAVFRPTPRPIVTAIARMSGGNARTASMMRIRKRVDPAAGRACDECRSRRRRLRRRSRRPRGRRPARSRAPSLKRAKTSRPEVVCAHRVLARRAPGARRRGRSSAGPSPDSGPNTARNTRMPSMRAKRSGAAVVHDETEGGAGGVHRPAAGTAGLGRSGSSTTCRACRQPSDRSSSLNGVRVVPARACSSVT